MSDKERPVVLELFKLLEREEGAILGGAPPPPVNAVLKHLDVSSLKIPQIWTHHQPQ